MKIKSTRRVKVSVPVLIEGSNEGARFENLLGTFDVRTAGDQKGIITQDEITKEILLAMPDGAAIRINLNELGIAMVKSWGQNKAKQIIEKGRK